MALKNNLSILWRQRCCLYGESVAREKNVKGNKMYKYHNNKSIILINKVIYVFDTRYDCKCSSSKNRNKAKRKAKKRKMKWIDIWNSNMFMASVGFCFFEVLAESLKIWDSSASNAFSLDVWCRHTKQGKEIMWFAIKINFDGKKNLGRLIAYKLNLLVIKNQKKMYFRRLFEKTDEK